MREVREVREVRRERRGRVSEGRRVRGEGRRVRVGACGWWKAGKGWIESSEDGLGRRQRVGSGSVSVGAVHAASGALHS